MFVAAARPPSHSIPVVVQVHVQCKLPWRCRATPMGNSVWSPGRWPCGSLSSHSVARRWCMRCLLRSTGHISRRF